MKTLNNIKSFVFICVFATISFVSFSQSQTGTEPDMQAYSIPNALKIDYQNPAQERIDIVVYDMMDNVLEHFTTWNAEGSLVYTAEELEAKGGTGTYNVVLYAGPDHQKTKGTVVVIIRE
jgi:hypothetical protein